MATKTTNKDFWNEKIPYTVPFDRVDNSDLITIVNGRSYQIQRGVEVMLPRNVVEALEYSQKQDIKNWRAAQAAERDFENEVKTRGL